MKIGMRTIKTAIAVSISIGIANMLGMENPLYAAIGAIISMQNTLNESFKAGRNRVLGTIIGALIGVVFAFINPESIILIGVGIIMVIYICNLLKWNNSISIAAVVFCVVMTSLNGKNPFFYGVNRIFDTCIGIIVAVLVNYFIFPPKQLDKILDGSNCILVKSIDLVKSKIVYDVDIKLKEFYKEIIDLEKILNEYIEEFNINKKDEIEVEKVKKIIDLCKDIYYHLQMVDRMEKPYIINRENYNKLTELYGFYNEKMGNISDDISIVFNYHLSKVIDNVYKFNTINISEIKKEDLDVII